MASFVLGWVFALFAAMDNVVDGPGFAPNVWDIVGAAADGYWVYFVFGKITERIQWRLLVRQRISEVVG